MTRTLKRLVLTGLFLLPLATMPAGAQTPTPEGTVIKNVASATFTDANNNTYATVKDSASVTVGYLAGPSPLASAASVTPAAGSTGNSMTFTLRNFGNGTDNFSVDTAAHAGVTITAWTYNGTPYATLALLNTALATAADTLKAGATGTLVLTYNVAGGTGGTSIAVTISQTSIRTPTATGASATATTTVNPPATRSVAVTPDGATATLLPKATTYSQSFTITNTGNSSDSYSFTVAVNSAVVGSVTIDKVDGGASLTGTTATLAAGGSATVTVTYFVNNSVSSVIVPAGTTASISLGATSTTLGSVSNGGDLTVTVARAGVTMTKVAYLDDLSAPVGASLVLPGQFIQYKITVTNSAAATSVAASNIAVSDVLPSEVSYVSVTPDTALPVAWAFTGSSTVTANLASLATGASRFFYIRVLVK